jgi:hypothetical protein
MNLYWVTDGEAEWGVYAFAHTRNKARYMLQNFEDWTEYVTTKAKLIGKTEEVEQETLVDDERHPLYPIVVKLGGKFTDLEGGEEEGDQNGN